MNSENIGKIEELLEEMAEEIDPYMGLFSEAPPAFLDSEKPLSVFSVTSFLAKVESLRIGLFEVAKLEEYYSLGVLFRALIEHFIKFQYMSMKMLNQSEDEIGIDYWLFGQDREMIDFAKSAQHAYRLLGIDDKYDVNEILKKHGIITEEKSASKIRKRSEQFQFNNMVRYISNQLEYEKSGNSQFLMMFFPKYSELSSCVHGGPESNSAYETGPERLKEAIRMSTFASLMTRHYTYMILYKYDTKFKNLCFISKSYLEKYCNGET